MRNRPRCRHLDLTQPQRIAVFGLEVNGVCSARANLERAAPGESAAWWQVEIGLALWALVDAGYDAGGVYAGRALDDAIAAVAVRDRAAQLLGQVAAAPLALRRELRRLDWLLEPLARGAVPGGEAPLWQLDYATTAIWSATFDAPPALPPAPGPEPRRGH